MKADHRLRIQTIVSSFPRCSLDFKDILINFERHLQPNNGHVPTATTDFLCVTRKREQSLISTHRISHHTLFSTAS